MKIFEIAESGRNTSWSVTDGTTITLDQLLSDIESVPVKKIKIENLKKKLLNWNNDPKEWERVKSVDMTDPPIILMSGSEVDMIVDGNHRIQKAIQLGYDQIDAKLIFLDKLPAKYIEI